MDDAQALAALGALSQATRLQLYRLLVARGPAGLSAGNIAEQLGVIPSSLSFHLQNLVHAGLITQRRAGRLMIYAASPDTMSDLLVFLTETGGRTATKAA
jgi:ArsR family transcriptional regulator, arsenate/arsenite/antimonite-responsive transcriptional repressor